MLKVTNLSFAYKMENRLFTVLNDINFTVDKGDFIAIQGPSGSGKSTLFHILGFLLKPSSGHVMLDGVDIANMSEDELTFVRNRKIGFVFQQFHLLSKTSVFENILLPTCYFKKEQNEYDFYENKARNLAKEFGLEAHLKHFPNQLSGGQQQRVAIARALINDVDLILADEPTGNLDSQNAQQILDLLTRLNKQGKTIVIITHDPEVSKRCNQTYHFKDGKFVCIENNKNVEIINNEKKINDVPLLKEHYFNGDKNFLFQNLKIIFPLVLKNIWRNRVKSLLTMIGIIIGVAAVLAMITLGQFAKKRILETYEALGVNKITIRGHQNWYLKATDQVTLNFRSFSWEQDLAPLHNVFSEVLMVSPLLQNWGGTVTAGGKTLSDKVTLLGVDPSYFIISNRNLKLGRRMSRFHADNRSAVCLVGHDIAAELFTYSNPIGQMIALTGGSRASFSCQIIGVLDSVQSNETWSPPNRQVLLPYTYFQIVIGDSWDSLIHTAVLQIALQSDAEQSGKKIKAYFEKRYGKAGIFSVDSDAVLIAQMRKFLNIFEILLAAVAVLSLIVGGIGINNMVLVSVTERIKEFGIRKALGATNANIRMQVLMESIVLCFIAGLFGIFIGFAAYESLIFAATKFVPTLKFEWIVEPGAMILSAISIVLVGVFSGLIPALRAEKLQIIEALRSE